MRKRNEGYSMNMGTMGTMGTMERCTKCRGSKKFSAMGFVEHNCPKCDGVGYTAIILRDNELVAAGKLDLSTLAMTHPNLSNKQRRMLAIQEEAKLKELIKNRPEHLSYNSV